MSYNRKYEHDIFLSYGRVDNLSEDGKGWVDLLFNSLQIAIARKVGKSNWVKIWKDTRQIDGSQLFDKTIEDALDNSAMILCLLSPGYLASHYCLKELQYFHQQASDDPLSLNVGDRNRICYLRLDKIVRDKMPKELGRSSGFDIHDKSDPAEHVDPHPISSDAAKSIIKDLSNAIIKTLESISEHTSTSGAAEASVAAPGSEAEEEDKFSIFLADVPDDLKSLKYKTSQFLTKKGFEVIQDIPPPFEDTEHEEKVSETLQQVDLSIHLLSKKPGSTVEDRSIDQSTYPQRHTQLAFEHVKNQMIWTPNDLQLDEIVDEPHKTFLQELHTKKDRDYQLIKGQRSTLENDIDDLITRLKEKEQETDAFDRPHVLLNTHINDQIIASDINLQLLKNNIQPFLNPQEDDPSANMNLLAEMIKRVNRIVFIYGGISKDWLLGLMSETLKVIVNNDFPVEDFTVFMVPPRKEREDVAMKQKFMKVNIIDNSSSDLIDPANLKGLLGA